MYANEKLIGILDKAIKKLEEDRYAFIELDGKDCYIFANEKYAEFVVKVGNDVLITKTFINSK